MSTDEEQKNISLDGPLFAINERSSAGIPAIELDTTTGRRVVLIFTSRQAAQKFCYLRRPEAEANIYELTRRTLDGQLVQTGLIKVARTLARDYPEVSDFVLDHPGTRGPAAYLSVEDAVYLGRRKPEAIEQDDLQSALDDALRQDLAKDGLALDED